MRDWVKHFVDQGLGRLPTSQAIDPLFYACAAMIAASLVLGGATRSGFLSDVILALLAVPLLAFVVWRLLDTDITRQMRWALTFCLALIALPLLQLIPLPGWLWTILPHREISAASFALIGEDPPWMPLSVSPEATWLSALSLLPPLSIFLGVTLLGYRDRRWLSLVILVVGLISVFLGLLQVAQGPASTLRFFQFTNLTEAVGFFANRNHFAALIYSLVLLTAAWAVNAGAAASSALSRREFNATSIFGALLCFTIFVVLLAAEAMARSRAGLALTFVAVLAAFSLGAVDRRIGHGDSAVARMLAGAIAIALLLIVQFALYRIFERFDVDPVQEARITFVSNTIEAARAYMPVGSGLGSFVTVYHLFEQPQDVIPNIFITRAHNDVVEAWLETGIFGLALMGWFVVWLVRRSLHIWRGGIPFGANELDWSLARSATIILALLAAHSFLDYPLRTTAIMAIVAFASALLINPPASALLLQPAREPQIRRARISTAAPKPVPSLVVSPVPTQMPKTPELLPSPARGERWGTDVQWPDEWGGSSEPPDAKPDPRKKP